jgi:transcription elongation factor
MLTSIAAIAAAISALIALGYSVAAAVKNKEKAEKIKNLQDMNVALKSAMTNEERNELQKKLDQLINS